MVLIDTSNVYSCPGTSCPRRCVTCLFPIACSRLYRHHGLQRPDSSLTPPSYPWRESVYPSPTILVPATPRFPQSSSIRAQHTTGRGSTSPFLLVECARDALSAPRAATANAITASSTASRPSYPLRVLRRCRPIEDPARPTLLPVLVGNLFMQNRYKG
jgi:hypothetical protein